MDRLTPERRSALMARIRGKDTAPERVLRGALHRAGYRYRLHVKNLPGCPDLVFPKRKKVIFVHGCFWHAHRNCRLGAMPKSNLKFWKPKLEGNRNRDKRNIRKLRSMGWQVLVVWQCKLGDPSSCLPKVTGFLEGGYAPS
jgi:DNA mismatch endonuclease (patch repair protein)